MIKSISLFLLCLLCQCTLYAQKGFHSYLGAEYSFSSFNVKQNNYYPESVFISDGKGLSFKFDYSFNNHISAGIILEPLIYNGGYLKYGTVSFNTSTPNYDSRFIFCDVKKSIDFSYDAQPNHFNTLKMSVGIGLHSFFPIGFQKTKLIDKDSSFHCKPSLSLDENSIVYSSFSLQWNHKFNKKSFFIRIIVEPFSTSYFYGGCSDNFDFGTDRIYENKFSFGITTGVKLF